MRVFKAVAMAAAIMKSSVWLLLAWSLVSSSVCLAKHAGVFPNGCTLKKSLKLSPPRPQGWNHRWFLENDLGTEGNHYCHGDSLWGRKEGEKYTSFLPSIFSSSFFLKTELIAVLCWITYSSSVLVFHSLLFSHCGRTCVGKHAKIMLPYELPISPENITLVTAVCSRGWASKLQLINPEKGSR